MADKKCTFSVIVPVLNEAETINAFLEHLRALNTSEEIEIIVVDADPDCETSRAITDKGIVTLSSTPGRARQMNAGAAVASGEILIFLHADTELPPNALERMRSIMGRSQHIGGAFDLGIKSDRFAFGLIARVASLRARVTRIPYGDQAIFLSRSFFAGIGGYRDIPIMEDIEIMQRIKKLGGKICLIPDRVQTSPRRWEKEGILYCTLRNWLLSSLFYLGVSPEKLSRYYSPLTRIRQ
jgi:rSAM/selenodomain-associated transferase 2